MNQLQEGKLSHSYNHRFVGVGWITTTGNGYQIKFIPESIGTYSNYTTGSYSLTALSDGTENITPQSGVVLSAADASFTPTAGSYVNQSVIYTLGTTTSDVQSMTKKFHNYKTIKTQKMSLKIAMLL